MRSIRVACDYFRDLRVWVVMPQTYCHRRRRCRAAASGYDHANYDDEEEEEEQWRILEEL